MFDNNQVVQVLGSGSSTGVPVVGCDCKVCHSSNPKDKRKRASLFLKSKKSQIIIDTGPDFRIQCLENSIVSLDAVLYTHSHYDHVSGIDELRAFSFFQKDPIPCYMDTVTKKILEKRNPYMFAPLGVKKKIRNIPNLQVYQLEKEFKIFKKIQIQDFSIQPILLLHEPFSGFQSIGYVFQEKFAYLTDFKKSYEENEEFLYNLDSMYLGSPVPFEHSSHISIPEALDLFAKFSPKKGYIGHLAHCISHNDLQKTMPSNITIAYDGLEIAL